MEWGKLEVKEVIFNGTGYYGFRDKMTLPMTKGEILFFNIKKGDNCLLFLLSFSLNYSAIERIKLITIHRSSSSFIFFSKLGISSLPIMDL